MKPHMQVVCFCKQTPGLPCEGLVWPTRVVLCRGVRNPMKMSDIAFLKTEPNRPRNSKTVNSVSAVQFSKTDFGGLGTVIHVVSFTVRIAA